MRYTCRLKFIKKNLGYLYPLSTLWGFMESIKNVTRTLKSTYRVHKELKILVESI